MLEMERQMEAMREEQQGQKLFNKDIEEFVMELAADAQALCSELHLVKSRQALGEERSGEVAALEVKYNNLRSHLSKAGEAILILQDLLLKIGAVFEELRGDLSQ